MNPRHAAESKFTTRTKSLVVAAEYYTKAHSRHRDAYGRDAGYSVNGLRRTTLGYDSATGRLATMNEGGGFTWQYLEGSHLKSRLTYPNGVTADYAYEPDRDLLTEVCNARGATVYSEYLYANDALGRRTAKNDERYGYNSRSELVSAATNGTGDYAYLYDDIGNRLSSLELGTNNLYTANSLNQYTMVGRVAPRPPEDDFAPQYDADGNQTLVRTATGTWSVTYNAENRPVRWTRGNTVVTMDFDSMGRRTFYRETENGRQVTFTRFFYDGYLMIQQLFSNAPYNIYKEFIWDPTEPVATKPLCFRQNGQAATFLTHDGNKNMTDVIRVSPYNDQVGHYDYAPFGAVRSQTGFRASANPFRFSSEFADDTLGLVYYNYRHYEPVTGRWLSRDLLESDHSLLETQFCHNAPNAIYDCLGRDWFALPGPPVGGWNAPPVSVSGSVKINLKEQCCCKVCLYSAIDIASSRRRGPLSIRGGMRGHTWITVEDCTSSNDQIVHSEYTFSFGPDTGHTDKEYLRGVPSGNWAIGNYTNLTKFVVSKMCWEQGSSACKTIKDDIQCSYPDVFSLSDYCTSTAVDYLRRHGIEPPSGIGEIEIPGPNVSRPNPRDMYRQIIDSGGADIKR